MFNPSVFSQKYEIQYGKNQDLGSTSKELKYAWSKPKELNLKLILDGTGVVLCESQQQKTVSERDPSSSTR